MSAVSTAQMASMRAGFEATMHDMGIVCPYTGTTTATSPEPNNPVSWDYTGTAITMGLDMDSRAKYPGSMVPADAEGRIRLPHGTAIDQRARIRVTERNGAELSPAWEFEVLGLPRAGMTGIQVWVKRVYGNVAQ